MLKQRLMLLGSRSPKRGFGTREEGPAFARCYFFFESSLSANHRRRFFRARDPRNSDAIFRTRSPEIAMILLGSQPRNSDVIFRLVTPK